MKVVVRLDLSKYTISLLKQLCAARIISKTELETELKERGLNDLTVLTIKREVV